MFRNKSKGTEKGSPMLMESEISGLTSTPEVTEQKSKDASSSAYITLEQELIQCFQKRDIFVKELLVSNKAKTYTIKVRR